ncbi:hypothetical protein KAU45_08220 [bacterium]|nr:hypothetical protein [bacterium]
MRRSFLIATLCGLTLFMSCDGDTGNGGEPEEYPDLSLGWGRLLAEEVRDAELPGGEQIYAFAVFVDGEGLLEDVDSFYHFFFAEPQSLLDTDGLWVTVYHSGDTGHFVGKCAYEEPLPVFSDAGPWIETADGALETIGGVDFTDRTYEVREAVLFHAWADFVVQVDYWWEPDRHRAKVILNAETNEIIDVEDHR